MKEIFKRAVILYLVLFITSVSFRSGSQDTIAYKISNLYVPFYKFLISIIQPNSERVGEVISDSTGMYMHVLFQGIIALFIAWNWKLLFSKPIKNTRITIDLVLSYYISFVLFFYGFNKFFQWQFEFPNANILFRRLGDIPKDLLFWSSMGTSSLYNICTGGIEILTGLLLLINRSRLIGFALALGVFFQILVINLSFDISVKLFSAMLFLFSILGLLNRARLISFDFSVLFRTSASTFFEQKSSFAKYAEVLKVVFSITILCFLLAPYIKANFTTADNSSTYPNEGAYIVSDNKIEIFKDAIRFFIYEDKSLSIENKLGEYLTFPIEMDYGRGVLILQDKTNEMQLKYSSKNNKFKSLIYKGDTLKMEYLNTNNFRLKEDSFHWTMDQ